MAKVLPIKNKKNPIGAQFPLIKKEEIPKSYSLELIEDKKSEVDEFHTIFWHRLFRKIYQNPLEIECELQSKDEDIKDKTVTFRRTDYETSWEISNISEENLDKLEKGKITPFPINWKYFVELPNGGLIEIGTKDRNTILYIGHVKEGEHVKNADLKAGKKFVSLLLEEARRHKQQLFNPKNEFKKKEDLKLYTIVNLYLSNYISGKFMLDIAKIQENKLREESLRYDARTDDLDDPEKSAHIDKYMFGCGMFSGPLFGLQKLDKE